MRIYFDWLIARAAETLLHCANLYRILGIDSKASVEMRVRYGGLKGRALIGSKHRPITAKTNPIEEYVTVPPITFRLGTIEDRSVELVKQLCEPLFMVFDFARFSDEVYRQIVTDFLKGKVS